jgi:hypothetical protein
MYAPTRRLLAFMTVVTLALLSACDSSESPAFDAAVPPGSDAGSDSGSDAGLDAGPDAGPDADADAGSMPEMSGPGAPCTIDNDCWGTLPEPPFEMSDTAGLRCVEGACGCQGDDDCLSSTAAGPVCDLETRGCGCTSSSDCTDDGAPICHEGACVRCVTSSDCDEDDPVCDGNRCVECTDATHCAADVDGLACIGTHCGCATNLDCPAESVCEPEEKSCIPPCVSDTDCVDQCDLETGLCVVA